ncbi:hypothetical protein RIF29_14201 [Crotalaria pallida]|uniref:Uncharacterized protein n=1 Tax=Crotalaria pallida TaxID=3830 RepID=A0AAN9FJL8_CROPI
MHDDDGVSTQPENRNTATWAFILRHSLRKPCASHPPCIYLDLTSSAASASKSQLNACLIPRMLIRIAIRSYPDYKLKFSKGLASLTCGRLMLALRCHCSY